MRLTHVFRNGRYPQGCHIGAIAAVHCLSIKAELGRRCTHLNTTPQSTGPPSSSVEERVLAAHAPALELWPDEMWLPRGPDLAIREAWSGKNRGRGRQFRRS